MVQARQGSVDGVAAFFQVLLEGGAVDALVQRHVETRADAMSYGALKRLEIARALVSDPSILVLDEPTSNLDPRARRLIIEQLRGFGHTTLIATHDMEMVLELCDRTLVMEQGRIVADGPTREVFSDLQLLDACGLEQPCSMRGCTVRG